MMCMSRRFSVFSGNSLQRLGLTNMHDIFLYANRCVKLCAVDGLARALCSFFMFNLVKRVWLVFF
jgi:hypothetical protein